jgi:hypothetical protein
MGGYNNPESICPDHTITECIYADRISTESKKYKPYFNGPYIVGIKII